MGKPAVNSDHVEGEWIVQREVTGSWPTIKEDLKGKLSFVRAFGPKQRWGLFRSALLKGRKRFKMSRKELPKGVRGLHPNYRYFAHHSQRTGTDPEFGQSWALENRGQTGGDGTSGIVGKDIGAVPAWELYGNRVSPVVAILDTGTDEVHEDLSSSLWTNLGEIPANGQDDDGNGFIDDVNGWDFVTASGDISDDNNHGTFCAGIVGARSGNPSGSRGVVPNARIMTVKMLDEYGMGTTERAVRAIEYAVNNGAKILNASWGGTKYDQVLYDTIKWAGSKGALFVAAAGNDGKDNDSDSSPIYPASFRLNTLLSVAAYNRRDELASFSNYGKTTVDIGAPGVEIFSTIRGGYKISDGTSFAAPFVTGVAALTWGVFPDFMPSEVRERLIKSSEVIGYYEKERTVSAGRAHAFNAIRGNYPQRPHAPTSWSNEAVTYASPHPYLNKTSETQTFRKPGASFIRLHFQKFETEACCDVLTVKDKNGVIISRYAGEREPFWTADAVGDTIVVEFSSDFSMTGYGFDIDSVGAAYSSPR